MFDFTGYTPIYVRDGGNNSNDGLTVGNAVATAQHAFDIALAAGSGNYVLDFVRNNNHFGDINVPPAAGWPARIGLRSNRTDVITIPYICSYGTAVVEAAPIIPAGDAQSITINANNICVTAIASVGGDGNTSNFSDPYVLADGGAAGNVTVYGVKAGYINSIGGQGSNGGLGGACGTITLTDCDVSGGSVCAGQGWGWIAGGTDNNIIMHNSTTSYVYTDGRDCYQYTDINGDTGGTAGNVTVTGNSTIGIIYARGGNASNSCSGSAGDGGTVIVGDTSTVSNIIVARGGTGIDVYATDGCGGTVTVKDNAVVASVDTMAGIGAVIFPTNGGELSVQGSATVVNAGLRGSPTNSLDLVGSSYTGEILIAPTATLTNVTMLYGTNTNWSSYPLKATLAEAHLKVTLDGTPFTAYYTGVMQHPLYFNGVLCNVGSTVTSGVPTGIFPFSDTDIFVSPSGSDETGDGTYANPFNTPIFAVNCAIGNTGTKVVHCAAFEYGVMYLTAAWPSRVHIVGDGASVTSIAAIYGTPDAIPVSDYPGQYLGPWGFNVEITSDHTITLENITTVGQNGYNSCGRGGNITLHNVTCGAIQASGGGCSDDNGQNGGTIYLDNSTATSVITDGGNGYTSGVAGDVTLSYSSCTNIDASSGTDYYGSPILGGTIILDHSTCGSISNYYGSNQDSSDMHAPITVLASTFYGIYEWMSHSDISNTSKIILNKTAVQNGISNFVNGAKVVLPFADVLGTGLL